MHQYVQWVDRKSAGDFGEGCIEFGPIFLQFRFFNSKRIHLGVEPITP